jgi:hypothetical protein
MALKFCDDTLKEGMSGSETSKGPAGLRKRRTGAIREEPQSRCGRRVRMVKRSDGRSGVRWMEE